MDQVNEFFNQPELVPMLMDWGGKILVALLIYLVGKWIVRRITNVSNKVMTSRDFDPTLLFGFVNLRYACLLA